MTARLCLVDSNVHPASADCEPEELCRIETPRSTRVLFRQSRFHEWEWIRKEHVR